MYVSKLEKNHSNAYLLMNSVNLNLCIGRNGWPVTQIQSSEFFFPGVEATAGAQTTSSK